MATGTPPCPTSACAGVAGPLRRAPEVHSTLLPASACPVHAVRAKSSATRRSAAQRPSLVSCVRE